MPGTWLKVDSPAIDVGKNSAVTELLDLADNDRIYNETVDLSAYESTWRLTVRNTADARTGSFRKAVADSISGGIVDFDASLDGQTIALASVVAIDKSLTVDASELSNGIVLSGDGVTRVLETTGSDNTGASTGFTVAEGMPTEDGGGDDGGGGGDGGGGTTITFTGLTIADGMTTKDGGGAVLIKSGSVSFDRCAFDGNRTSGSGGALSQNTGFVSLTNCLFQDNAAVNGGAAHFNGRITAVNSAFAGNHASTHGGAIYADAGAASRASRLI